MMVINHIIKMTSYTTLSGLDRLRSGRGISIMRILNVEQKTA